jgi:hypothetical protein
MDDNFIPSTLEECFEALDNMLPAEEKEKIRTWSEDEMGFCHFGLGMWMRNNWGLWGGGNLRDWFNAHDVWHADDMSGIILTSYWRRMHNEPLLLDEQVQYYSDYWEKAGVDVKANALKARECGE